MSNDNSTLYEILQFRKLVQLINKELKTKKIYDCEYMLINHSVEDIIHVLEDSSDSYNLIKDDVLGNGIKFSDCLERYFILVKRYYETLFIKGGDQDKVADKYFKKISEPVKRNGDYIYYNKSNMGMIMSDVQKTLSLMKEAVQVFYKVYNNKMLIAELSTKDIDNSDYLEFQIKENELLHLLGVTAGQLRDNPDFQKLTGNKKMNSIQILEWILKDTESNNDLLQYSEDFIQKILNSNNYDIVNRQFSPEVSSQLLNYHKIKSKSETFMKYGPLEKISLVVKLQDNVTLSKNSKSNTAMITKTDVFKKYPWAYFGSVQQPDNKYIETLQIDSSNHKKELFRYSRPAIVKGIETINESGSVDGGRLFSLEEQFDLFVDAYTSFGDVMDFTDLISYFQQLVDSYDPDISYGKPRI